MTLAERQRSLSLRWSGLDIRSPEWQRGREAAGGSGGMITWGPDKPTNAAISISNGKARGDQTHFTVMIRSLSLHTDTQTLSIIEATRS